MLITSTPTSVRPAAVHCGGFLLCLCFRNGLFVTQVVVAIVTDVDSSTSTECDQFVLTMRDGLADNARQVSRAYRPARQGRPLEPLIERADIERFARVHGRQQKSGELDDRVEEDKVSRRRERMKIRALMDRMFMDKTVKIYWGFVAGAEASQPESSSEEKSEFREQ